ncbi:tRNA uridine-5-carboxymethylaminomethyl(34) synthesis enzyme MnmG [candidate division WOR-3 bacterium]|nr:tRNA uridine-5-carboxymethylaminomethyl(34) synthesis enzyme MnmG [candidate division WOR-3 bacterium]
MVQTTQYDVIVIGGGHAGIEAALAPARMGFNVLLLTLNIDNIGQMSCNPSIGGLAKGHLVKEVDTLGGEIGLLADKTAIQYRMLNRSKGPAVWSPRTQNDRLKYRVAAQEILENTKNIKIKQEEASEIIIDGHSAIGVKTSIGNEYRARAIVLTTGTFLNGLMHIGLDSFAGGRLAEARSSALSESLKRCGLNLGRLKTGTSPRIAKNSVDLSNLQVHKGEEKHFNFSFRTEHNVIEQLSCYITRTNKNTHDIIQKNLDRSPLYSGKIVGVGPRYCPSIETKIVRFADRDSHLVFIEPEGRDSGEFYLNGLATSLPYDVQLDMLRSIEGLGKVEITRPGYAVEYDFVYPVQLYPSLETKAVKNLFCAGQINGTSGYEEAAAQGIMAGINAVLKLRDEKPFILKRYEAYIGVLIDDLITKNTLEPYRMFTSLAEHRLILRIDNVADRLMHYGVKYGLIKEDEWQRFEQDRKEIDNAIENLKKIIVKAEIANPILKEKGEKEIPDERGGMSLFQILKRPGIQYQDIERMSDMKFEENIGTRVKIETKYNGYIKREDEMIEKLKETEKIRIPANFSYVDIKGLSNEAKSKLSEVKPENLDQASRIQGISPSDILLLLLHLKKKAGEGLRRRKEGY